MYLDYFGFRTAPFSIAPDPQYLYLTERHREALAHLMYGVRESCGFVLLTGEIGTGKTTLCRCLLEQVPDTADIAFIFNPRLSSLELLSTVCDEFHIDYPRNSGSLKERVERIYRFLLQNHASGRSAVLIIDEAQNLSAKVLEQLRLLTNLETSERKLLQIILLGQPQLRQLLEQPELQQLAQRITARYHLLPLQPQEVAAYVGHRLAVAGCRQRLFPPATLRRLYRLSGGIPRVINLLCDRALMGAYARDAEQVSPALLAEAAKEVFGKAPAAGSWWRKIGWGLAAAAMVAVGALLAMLLPGPQPGWLDVVVPEAVAPVGAPAPEAGGQPEPAAVTDVAPAWWPAAPQEEASRQQAFADLFQLWGGRGIRSCEEAARLGLECLSLRGSLGSLRQYNRPAVLQLVTPQGEPFHGLLTALDPEEAELLLDGEQRRLTYAQLERVWQGRYTLAWRLPEGYRSGVSAAQPELQAWVRKQLRLLGIQSDGLAAELRAFQTGEGLMADGRIGPMTLMRLQDRRGEGSPRLVD